MSEEPPRHSGQNWEEIVAAQQKYVYNLAYQLCGDPYDADDLTQETFLKALENVGRFRGEASIRTWLSRITVNTYLVRKRRKEKHVSMALELIPAPDGSSNPEKMVIRRELQWCIHHILQHHLSRDYRIVIVLRDLNRLSYHEIAEILGISDSAVKSRLHRARQAYRDHLLKTGCAGLLKDYSCYCDGVVEL